jgi:RHS repeat-associated protein
LGNYKYFDAETGLHYNYFRDYDPEIGRYIQSDPIGLAGGINTYGYANQNPIMNYDPNGLTSLAMCANPVNAAACAAAGYGAIGGAVAGAGISAASQYYNTGCVDMAEVGNAGLEGMFFGATIALAEVRLAGAILGRMASSSSAVAATANGASSAAQAALLREFLR